MGHDTTAIFIDAVDVFRDVLLLTALPLTVATTAGDQRQRTPLLTTDEYRAFGVANDTSSGRTEQIIL
jgi:hypothetical protein